MHLERFRKIPIFGKIVSAYLDIQETIDTCQSRLDISEDLYQKFQNDRETEEYRLAFLKPNPLISICICTYNRAELLISRSLKSLLGQQYRNIEIIVVGDQCTDDTENRMRYIQDSRVRFVNLEERGVYPKDPLLRWMVAGTKAVNKALEISNGDFITHLDDDDEHLPDRTGKLVRFIQAKKADFVWHPFWREMPSGRWQRRSETSFRKSGVTTSSSFYHHWFKQIPWDINAYRYNEPGDWNRFRKIKYLGARIARFPEPLLKHYRERRQISH